MRRKYTLNFRVYCPKVVTVYLHDFKTRATKDKLKSRPARTLDAVNALV